METQSLGKLSTSLENFNSAFFTHGERFDEKFKILADIHPIDRQNVDVEIESVLQSFNLVRPHHSWPGSKANSMKQVKSSLMRVIQGGT